MHDLATIQRMNEEANRPRGKYGDHDNPDPYGGAEGWELELLVKDRWDAKHWNGFVRAEDGTLVRGIYRG